ncbi:MAG: heavy metal-associated domain-containing protein [Phycisphaerales bacterium]|jgi:copper chaperone CopZ
MKLRLYGVQILACGAAILAGSLPSLAQAEPVLSPATAFIHTPLPIDLGDIGKTPAGWTESWLSLALASYMPDSSPPPSSPVWKVVRHGGVGALRGEAPPGGLSTLIKDIPFVEGSSITLRFSVRNPGPRFAFGAFGYFGFPERPSFAGLWTRENRLDVGILDIQCWIENGGFSHAIPFDTSIEHVLTVEASGGFLRARLDDTSEFMPPPGTARVSGGVGTNVRQPTNIPPFLGLFAEDGTVEITRSELRLPMQPQRVSFDVTGMHCEMCEANIEGAIEKIPGVKKVTSSYKAGRVEVEIDPAAPPSNDAMIKAIEALKYAAKVHEEPPAPPK